MESTEPPPEGPEEVRSAIIAAARRCFAAGGPRVSLREIARDARVNLGLIHRYIGNKDDLIAAVIADRSRLGESIVGRHDDPGAAMAEMFGATAAEGASARTIAWLLLTGEHPELLPERFPAIAALRELLPDDTDDLGLLAAITLTFGWAVFGDRLLAAFDRAPGDAATTAEALGALAARLVTDHDPRS